MHLPVRSDHSVSYFANIRICWDKRVYANNIKQKEKQGWLALNGRWHTDKQLCMFARLPVFTNKIRRQGSLISISGAFARRPDKGAARSSCLHSKTRLQAKGSYFRWCIWGLSRQRKQQEKGRGVPSTLRLGIFPGRLETFGWAFVFCLNVATVLLAGRPVSLLYPCIVGVGRVGSAVRQLFGLRNLHAWVHLLLPLSSWKIFGLPCLYRL